METRYHDTTRIAVFYDGGYFDEVSRYYKFGHPRGSRLSFEGVQRFIRYKTAAFEKRELARCPIVESHYFRGRFSAADAEAAGKLRDQAIIDDILIRSDVSQHYLPVTINNGERPKERGIDLRLALEAYDQAIHGKYDLLALVGCDGDYAALVKKLAGVGARSMVLAWDFHYSFEDQAGRKKTKETRTAKALIEACTWPVMMSSLVDDPPAEDRALVDQLFV